MQLRVSRSAIAALLLCSSFATAKACSSNADESPTAHLDSSSVKLTKGMDAQTALIARAAQASLSAEETGSIAEVDLPSPTGMLLYDHEGESFTYVTASAKGIFDMSSDEISTSEIAGFSETLPSAADLPVRRFLVEDDDVAVFALLHDDPTSTASTGSTATLFPDFDLALDGYEDR